MMGWRSRSTLYRLRDSGALLGYVRESAKGGTVLEMSPPIKTKVTTQVNQLKEQVKKVIANKQTPDN